MSQQFLRTATLSLGSGAATINAGGPNDLRLQFAVESHTSQSPSKAQIVLTNASASTAAKFIKEFTALSLSAGYEGNSGPIFSGTIVETQYGERINDFTDTLLRIWCSGADFAYNQSRVSTTLAAGSTPQDMVNTCLQSMAQYGVTMGQVAGIDLSGPTFPRGVTMMGMTRDFLREIALSKGATWTINNGKLDFIGKNATPQSSGIVISAATGMLGQCILRQTGVIVRVRINPALQINTVVTLNAEIVSTTIQNTEFAAFGGPTPADQMNLLNQTNSSNKYRVLAMKTTGDSRGGPWETELTLLGVGQQPNQAQLSAGLGSS